MVRSKTTIYGPAVPYEEKHRAFRGKGHLEGFTKVGAPRPPHRTHSNALDKAVWFGTSKCSELSSCEGDSSAYFRKPPSHQGHNRCCTSTYAFTQHTHTHTHTHMHTHTCTHTCTHTHTYTHMDSTHVCMRTSTHRQATNNHRCSPTGVVRTYRTCVHNRTGLQTNW